MGVKFEADNIYTLDSNGRMILTILASVAEEESHSKSIIMNWSIDRRFSRGLFLTPALLGYDKDEEGNLVINPEEAQTVKVIYYLYLNGYSLTEIATLLMEYQGSAVLDETEREAGTTSVPIPQGEDSENTPLPDLPEQPENVQRPGSEVVEKGMLT